MEKGEAPIRALLARRKCILDVGYWLKLRTGLPDCPKIEQNVSNLSDLVISCPIPESQNSGLANLILIILRILTRLICQAVLQRLHSGKNMLRCFRANVH